MGNITDIVSVAVHPITTINGVQNILVGTNGNTIDSERGVGSLLQGMDSLLELMRINSWLGEANLGAEFK